MESEFQTRLHMSLIGPYAPGRSPPCLKELPESPPDQAEAPYKLWGMGENMKEEKRQELYGTVSGLGRFRRAFVPGFVL